jgi:hypothetical protein
VSSVRETRGRREGQERSLRSQENQCSCAHQPAVLISGAMPVGIAVCIACQEMSCMSLSCGLVEVCVSQTTLGHWPVPGGQISTELSVSLARLPAIGPG